MELVYVNIVCSQIGQGGLQVFPEGIRRFGSRLCGNEDLVPHAVECFPDFQLTVGIGPGGIKKTHTARVSFPQQPDRHLCTVPLDGETAESVLGYSDFSLS